MASEKKNKVNRGGIDADSSEFKYDKGVKSAGAIGLTARDWYYLIGIVGIGFVVRFFRLTQPNSVV
jgi:dolichyl-phosphate-mannose-protein mannosyltransferase